MLSLDQYLIPSRNAEILLARSAAPESISSRAEILVLGRRGYESAVKGHNGFICMVQRSWAAGVEDPEFWNPKLRAPSCFNAAAARSIVPHIKKKSLAGLSKAQIRQRLEAAVAKGELIPPEPGAMCYMMSAQGYLSDRDGRWRPHLMFFVPAIDPAAWGAGLKDSPLIGIKDAVEQYTVFFLPVDNWSDGSPAHWSAP
jgi:hypothetical protein